MNEKNKAWINYERILTIIVFLIIGIVIYFGINKVDEEVYYNKKSDLSKEDALMLGERKLSEFYYLMSNGNDYSINDILISSNIKDMIYCVDNYSISYRDIEGEERYYCQMDNLEEVKNILFTKRITFESIFTKDTLGYGIKMFDNKYLDYYNDNNYLVLEDIKISVSNIQSGYITYKVTYDVFSQPGEFLSNEEDIFSLFKEDEVWKINKASFLYYDGKINIE